MSDTRDLKISMIKSLYNDLVTSMHTLIVMQDPSTSMNCYNHEGLRKLVIHKQLDVFDQMMKLRKRCDEIGAFFPTNEMEIGAIELVCINEEEKKSVTKFFQEAISQSRNHGKILTWPIFKDFLEFEFKRAKEGKGSSVDDPSAFNKTWHYLALGIIGSGVSTWSNLESDLEKIFTSLSQ
jgi:hypothetical protein